ncbi:response regulator transcription factor [Streptomyces sp. NPDC006516]|uniref:response regulator transcription factor n=1 Tax=Streptomyces sp. NPDC006516 TaxID=3154309 RepID=UPI0033AABFD9
MSRGPARLLVAEGPRGGGRSPAVDLRRHTFPTTTVGSGAAALAAHAEADLILIDRQLPDMDGLEVCRRIRTTSRVPVIVVSGGATEIDRVLALDAGTDHLLDRPYHFQELLARIEALTRRSVAGRDPGSRPASAPVTLGPLRIDTDAREVRLDGTPVPLTRKEFDVLYHLARRPGTVISRRRLLREIWHAPQPGGAGSPTGRTLDTHISSLRGKLGNTDVIRTVRGVGFMAGPPLARRTPVDGPLRAPLTAPPASARPHASARVLVVAADSTTLDALTTALRHHGHRADGCPDASEVPTRQHAYDLLLIASGLPGIDALNLCQAVRTVTDTPIVVLTGPGETLDQILFLRAGCDDSFERPQGTRELTARVEAVLRRTRTTHKAAGPLLRGALRMDPADRDVRFDGRPLRLTRKEFDLLYRLAAQPRTVHTRSGLIAEIWGERAGRSTGRTLDTHVSSLRGKLGPAGVIVTVRGVGFRLGDL